MNDAISNYFMQFQELNNKQWNMIEPHIPKPAHTGVQEAMTEWF